ncbi:predicted protein [Nematostella vectensis]|uniref:G-protein coupled receptors family 1 profile domain-containing protein n=1 Tax=Nematostella vectensis TaxID=45351 RepID=A7RQS7_NEMVE|nr:predicted protein [Nematostella vectensis]|eukprot:XP_001638222.1 predicted protein [Nematostella vectensis]
MENSSRKNASETITDINGEESLLTGNTFIVLLIFLIGVTATLTTPNACHGVYTPLVLCEYATVFTLCSISVQQYKAITRLFRQKPSSSSQLLVIMVIWLGSVVFTAQLEIDRYSRNDVNNPRKPRNKRVFIVIAAMVITFAICLLPQHLILLVTEWVPVPRGLAFVFYVPVLAKASIAY